MWNKSRVFKAVGAQVLGQILGVAFRVFGVAIFFQTIGSTIYGEWLFLLSVASFLGLLEFGVFNTFFNKMTVAYSEKNFEHFKMLDICTQALSVLIISVAICLGLLVNLVFYEFNLPLSNLMLAISLSIWFGARSGLYRCTERQHILFHWGNVAQFYPQLGVLLIAYFSSPDLFLSYGSWVYLGSWVSLIVALEYSLYFDSTFKKISDQAESFTFQSADIWKELRLNFSEMTKFGTISINQWLENNLILFVLRFMSGFDAVSIFSAFKGITNSFRSVLAIFLQSLWPEFTLASHNGDNLAIQKLIAFFSLLTVGFYIFGAGIIIGWIDPILHWWLGYSGGVLGKFDFLIIWLGGLFLALYSIVLSVLMASSNVNFISMAILYINLIMGIAFGFIWYLEIENTMVIFLVTAIASLSMAIFAYKQMYKCYD